MYIYSNFTVYSTIKILFGKVFSEMLNMTHVFRFTKISLLKHTWYRKFHTYLMIDMTF